MIITVFGSLNYDLVTISGRLPEAGETISAEKFERHHGGKGANQCVAVKRLSDDKIKVKMIGRVGKDLFGQELVDGMRAAKIDVSEVRAIDGVSTGVATIFVDKASAENRILVYPGANGTWEQSPETFKDKADTEQQMIILQNEIPAKVVYQALEIAHSEGLLTVYNPSPVLKDTPLSVYKNVDYLVVNTTEADVLVEAFTGTSHQSIDNNENLALEALTTLSQYLPSTTKVIITLGKNGYAYTPGKKGEAGKPPGPLVDTTGAGDTFLGAFASSIIQNPGDMESALKKASKASAIAVTRSGAAESIPFLAEL